MSGEKSSKVKNIVRKYRLYPNKEQETYFANITKKQEKTLELRLRNIRKSFLG